MAPSLPPTKAPFISSPSNSSPSSLNSCLSDRAMDEEVWQEIELPSLDENSTNNLNISSLPSSNFQDFLPPSPAPARVYRAAAVRPASSRPVPILSLFSGSELGHLSGEISTGRSSRPAAVFGSASGGGVFGTEAASSSKKRPQLDGENSDASDRKRQRRIKNRESANRSRARKLAYAQELEMEVDKLKTENAKLKQKLLTEQPQLTKKKKLCRTLSAPF